MGGNSCNEGRGFESQHCKMDRKISHIFVVKNVMFVWKDENKQKEAGDCPFLEKVYLRSEVIVV